MGVYELSVMEAPYERTTMEELICEKCEKADRVNKWFDANEYTTENVEDAAGYCDRHGKHDDFHTMEI